LAWGVLPPVISVRWRSSATSAFFRTAMLDFRSACSVESSISTSGAPLATSCEDSNRIARTTPPTCGATSTPCSARKVPIAGTRGIQRTVSARAAATAFVGCGSWEMMPLIISGFTKNWK
jgi:hypothetical protein